MAEGLSGEDLPRQNNQPVIAGHAFEAQTDYRANVVIQLELVAIAAGPAVMPLSWGFLCVDSRRMAVMTEVDRNRDRDRQ